MPKENKLLFGLSDIRSVRFTCNDCGSVQAFPLADWKTVPQVCMNNSSHEWAKRDSTETLGQLRDTLKKLLKLDGSAGFKIQIEFDDNKVSQPSEAEAAANV